MAIAMIDTNSRTWMYLAEWANTRIQELRKTNDNPAMDELTTARLRGRLLQLKELLALANPQAPKEGTEDL